MYKLRLKKFNRWDFDVHQRFSLLLQAAGIPYILRQESDEEDDEEGDCYVAKFEYWADDEQEENLAKAWEYYISVKEEFDDE